MMRQYWMVGAVAAVMGLAVTAGIAQQKQSLVKNGGFEEPTVSAADGSKVHPADWTVFAKEAQTDQVSVVTAVAHAGKQAVRIVAKGSAEDFQGLFQMQPVQAGKTLRMAAWVMNDPKQPLAGTVRGQIVIEWKDQSGQEIDRTYGPDWDRNLKAGQWTLHEMTGTAPAGATAAHFTVTLMDGAQPAKGAFLVDDVSVE